MNILSPITSCKVITVKDYPQTYCYVRTGCWSPGRITWREPLGELSSRLWQTPDKSAGNAGVVGKAHTLAGSEMRSGPELIAARDLRVVLCWQPLPPPNRPSGCSHAPKMPALWLRSRGRGRGEPSRRGRAFSRRWINRGRFARSGSDRRSFTSPRACVLPACESRPVDDKTWRERERDRDCCVSDFPNIKINELIDGEDLWL